MVCFVPRHRRNQKAYLNPPQDMRRRVVLLVSLWALSCADLPKFEPVFPFFALSFSAAVIFPPWLRLDSVLRAQHIVELLHSLRDMRLIGDDVVRLSRTDVRMAQNRLNGIGVNA